MTHPNYDYDQLINDGAVKFIAVQVPHEGVWLQLQEGIPEDAVLFRFVDAHINDAGFLEFKLDVASPEPATERLYEYAARVLSQSLAEALTDTSSSQ